MTNNEAIYICTGLQVRVGEHDRIHEALEIVMRSTKRQIPTRPTMYVGEYDHERYPLCPACNQELMPNGEKYCSDCGQKIDWSTP